ncbi:putative aldouronate transport system substrate-binding protein [Paenibacillus sp. 1_12]|uniref:extracellular solute-binding protein n=1 Tax=Paenibacillus sp. 1_12 TaxID=1566278 RepID=UPI0008E1C706|nr:extracellular solute-binding protein [Paenibacillus sp. 1_12]SFK95638.1 putative aldouronate transport system substrate-binding protein [Paenibacillus sp. 1_12]
MNQKSLKKAFVPLLLTSALLTVTACSKDPVEAPKIPTADSTAPATGIKYTAPFKDGKYDPPITLTTIGAIQSSTTFKNGETMENNVHTKWAKDHLGIELKYNWTAPQTNNAFDTRLRLALSANEEMPDVVSVTSTALANDLIDSGKFMEVGKLWEQYASPNYKKAVNEDPSMWYPFMRKDGAYAIPIPDYSFNDDTVFYIREDWLEKLNLKAPQTMDDLEKVMDAFVNQDPDGNGKNDTYGLALSLRDSIVAKLGSSSWLYGAFGVMPEIWNENSDGTLAYGSVQPGVKPALGKMKEWMAKGYIHKEAALQDETKASALFTSGRAGIIPGPHWMTLFPLADLAKNVPGSKFKAYAIPKNADGKQGRKGTLNFSGSVLINKNVKNPEAFFVYQNDLFENFAWPKKGGEFEYQFAENYDYILIDGKPTVDTNKIPGGRVLPEKYTISGNAARIPSSQMEAYAKVAKGPASNPYEVRATMIADPPRLEAALVNLALKDTAKAFVEKFTAPPTKTMKSRWDNLKQQEKEVFTKIIYGETPIDEFDKFTKTWESSGGSTITQEVNEWYASVKKK